MEMVRVTYHKGDLAGTSRDYADRDAAMMAIKDSGAFVKRGYEMVDGLVAELPAEEPAMINSAWNTPEEPADPVQDKPAEPEPDLEAQMASKALFWPPKNYSSPKPKELNAFRMAVKGIVAGKMQGWISLNPPIYGRTIKR